MVLGTTSDSARTQESQKLLNWGFQNFDTVKLYSKGQAIQTPEVWKGSKPSVKIGFANDVLVTVPKGVAGKMKPVLERKDPLVAPLALNGRVGTLKMTVDGKAILELPVVALEEVPQASIFGRGWDSLRFCSNSQVGSALQRCRPRPAWRERLPICSDSAESTRWPRLPPTCLPRSHPAGRRCPASSPACGA